MSNLDSELIYSSSPLSRRRLWTEASNAYRPDACLQLADGWHMTGVLKAIPDETPVIVDQYISDRKTEMPKVMIFNISRGNRADDPIVQPPPHHEDQSGRADHRGIYRTGTVERHIDIPAWLIPYAHFLTGDNSGSMTDEGYKTMRHRGMEEPTRLEFYTDIGAYMSKPTDHVGTSWTRSKILQAIYLHGGIAHNVHNIDFTSLLDSTPDHRTTKSAFLPVHTTFPEPIVNAIWQQLFGALKDGLDNGVEKEHFGNYDTWQTRRGDIGYDRVFYETDIDDHSYQVPKTIKTWLEERHPEMGKYKTATSGYIFPFKVCEHTCRDGFHITPNSIGGATVGGGMADLSIDKSSYYQVDKLVHLYTKMLEFEGNVNGKFNSQAGWQAI